MRMAKDDHSKPIIVVIGAGVAGFSAALDLADRGYHVELIEKNTLGSGASGNNPGRMGHGFHYTDIETALAYLHASIRVQKKYPGFLIGQDLPFEHPFRHGRYFVVKDSDHPPETVLKTFHAIEAEYKRLVELDPSNAVFGPPETFFRVLEPKDYAHCVNPDIVSLAVETCEHLFNWSKFATYIKTLINDHPNIHLVENTTVQTITRNDAKDMRFTLHTCDKSGNEKDIKTSYVINSTWQNIKEINEQINLHMVPGERTIRLKALLEVDLTQSLRDEHSMFFGMGQHGMMSNMGDGRGMFTYAKVTNLEASTAIAPSKNMERLLNGGVTLEEKEKISKEMLAGISYYIPDMAGCTVRELKFGIVQTQGELTLNDLNDKNNPFHKRADHCVTTEQIGVISNPCMKLFYFVDNGELVADLLEKHIIASNKIEDCMALLKPMHVNKHIRKSLKEYLERYETLERLVTVNASDIVNDYLKGIHLRNHLSPFFKQVLQKEKEKDTAKEEEDSMSIYIR